MVPIAWAKELDSRIAALTQPVPATQKENKMSYDQKCYELAEHFLADGTPKARQALAQLIQDTVESFAYEPIVPVPAIPNPKLAECQFCGHPAHIGVCTICSCPQVPATEERKPR